MGVTTAVDVETDDTCTTNVVGFAALPPESFALHVTVVLPTPKSEPETGVHSADSAVSWSSVTAGTL